MRERDSEAKCGLGLGESTIPAENVRTSQAKRPNSQAADPAENVRTSQAKRPSANFAEFRPKCGRGLSESTIPGEKVRTSH